MNRLSARERRLIALLVTVAGIALLWLGLISPLVNGFANRTAEREQLALEFQRNERLITSIYPLRRQIETQTRDRANYRMPGADAAQATEALKERLGGIMAAGGGELRAVQEAEAQPGWVRAWAEARLTLPQTIAALEKVQNQTPYLAITSLSIAADRALQSGRLDLMDVRIEAASPAPAAQSR